MKIIFFGSDDFAAVNLRRLLKTGTEVLAVIAPPDKPQGRGMNVAPCLVKECALGHDVPILQPASLQDDQVRSELADFDADLFIVIAYGRLLPQKILDFPRLFCLNAHASLLPKYRGAAPINWALINGEQQTGVTLIKMNAALDAGDIIAQSALSIMPEDTAVTLREKLADLSSECLTQTLKRVDEDKVTFTAQNQNEVTWAPKLTKQAGLIDWKQPAARIHGMVRGLLPWPTAHTLYDQKILKLLKTEVVESPAVSGSPGMVCEITAAGILVATGRHALLIKRLHPESGRPMDAGSFISGHKLTPGYRFGT